MFKLSSDGFMLKNSDFKFPCFNTFAYLGEPTTWRDDVGVGLCIKQPNDMNWWEHNKFILRCLDREINDDLLHK